MGDSQRSHHCTLQPALYYTVLYLTVQNCTALQNTELHCTILHYTVQHCTTPYYTELHCIVQLHVYTMTQCTLQEQASYIKLHLTLDKKRYIYIFKKIHISVLLVTNPPCGNFAPFQTPAVCKTSLYTSIDYQVGLVYFLLSNVLVFSLRKTNLKCRSLHRIISNSLENPDGKNITYLKWDS